MPTKASTSSAHTPGPWFLEPVDLIVYDGDRLAAEAVATIEYRSSVEEREANAWLIAAAPQMLDKLRSYACDCQIRISVLREEMAEVGLTEGDDDAADYIDQIEHWRATKSGVERVIAQAEGG